MTSRYLELIRLSLRQIAEICPQNINFDTFLSVANPLLRAPPK